MAKKVFDNFEEFEAEIAQSQIQVGDRVRVEFWQGKDDLCGDVLYLPMQAGENWVIRTIDRIFYVDRYATISKRIPSGE